MREKKLDQLFTEILETDTHKELDLLLAEILEADTYNELDLLLDKIHETHTEIITYFTDQPQGQNTTNNLTLYELQDQIDHLCEEFDLDMKQFYSESRQQAPQLSGNTPARESKFIPTWEEVCRDIGWNPDEGEPALSNLQSVGLENEPKKLFENLENSDINKKPENKQSVPVRIISNVMFYLLLICVVFGVFIVSGKDSSPRNIFGYSYFTVVTGSMQSVIPKGSLVITKQIDASSINVGDDITFFKDENTTITHRVVEVIENYQDSGHKAFKTKGVENPAPDKDIVEAQNIIGVVKFTFPGLGTALIYIKNNILLVSIMFALLILLSICIKVFFANGERRKSNESMIMNYEAKNTYDIPLNKNAQAFLP